MAENQVEQTPGPNTELGRRLEGFANRLQEISNAETRVTHGQARRVIGGAALIGSAALGLSEYAQATNVPSFAEGVISVVKFHAAETMSLVEQGAGIGEIVSSAYKRAMTTGVLAGGVQAVNTVSFLKRMTSQGLTEGEQLAGALHLAGAGFALASVAEKADDPVQVSSVGGWIAEKLGEQAKKM